MTFGFLWNKFGFKKVSRSDNSLIQVNKGKLQNRLLLNTYIGDLKCWNGKWRWKRCFLKRKKHLAFVQLNQGSLKIGLDIPRFSIIPFPNMYSCSRFRNARRYVVETGFLCKILVNLRFQPNCYTTLIVFHNQSSMSKLLLLCKMFSFSAMMQTLLITALSL